jgi:O-succinylbenzoic acid--CoA ligase
MEFNLPGLQLNNKLFSVEELRVYAAAMLENNLPDWEHKIYAFILNFLDDKDFILQQSSGTTGTPKTFQLSKKAMLESARLTCEVLDLRYGQNALLCLSADYIAGKMIVVRSLVCGLNLFWEEPSSLPALQNYNKIHLCSMVPLQAFNAFNSPKLLQNIDVLLIGGAEIRPELKALFGKINNRSYETYGMAETCSHIALKKISGPNPDANFKTLPGIKVNTDHRSCLVAHVPFLPEPVVSNDVVETIDEQTFVWKTRFDNLINTGGLKVIPEEVETEIAKILKHEFAIIGLPDKKLGQKITLVIESEKRIDENQLRETLSKNLKPHQIPKEIRYLKILPRNAAFKVERKKLLLLFV